VKRTLAIALPLLAVLCAGAWWGTRHGPAGSLLDEPVSPFALEPAPPGWRVHLNDSSIPLRALRWLPPTQEGVLVAQLQTQSDRQQLAVFRDGGTVSALQVGRPQGVGEGFWRFARLQDAHVAANGTVVLLYTGGATAQEPSLAMAVDPASPDARWAHRGPYTRMAVSGGAEPTVFLYGGKGPVQRLALAGAGRRPVSKDLELPAEVPAAEDLLPTGASSFLVCSAVGLSSYAPAKGWTHFPLPADHGLACAGWHPSLAQSGKRIWWQPAPGKLVQVGPDGATVTDLEVMGFAADDPQARDAQLLQLLGAAPSGRLWFGLAAPQAAADWTAYAALGLDRIYRWNPVDETLERSSWYALKPPPDVPAGAPQLHPGAGSLLLEGARAGWWTPLKALPFAPVAGAQAR